MLLNSETRVAGVFFARTGSNRPTLHLRGGHSRTFYCTQRQGQQPRSQKAAQASTLNLRKGQGLEDPRQEHMPHPSVTFFGQLSHASSRVGRENVTPLKLLGPKASSQHNIAEGRLGEHQLVSLIVTFVSKKTASFTVRIAAAAMYNTSIENVNVSPFSKRTISAHSITYVDANTAETINIVRMIGDNLFPDGMRVLYRTQRVLRPKHASQNSSFLEHTNLLVASLFY